MKARRSSLQKQAVKGKNNGQDIQLICESALAQAILHGIIWEK